MQRYLLPVIVLTAFAGFLAQQGLAQSALQPLEGTWNVTVTPDNAGQEYHDIWTIKPNDTFTSVAMNKKGFGPGHVDEDTRRFGPTKWKTTIKSDKDGAMKYQGTADGVNITGTIEWTKPGGETVSYSFKGTPKR